MHEDEDDDDGYDWSEENLVPALVSKEDGAVTWLPREMYLKAIELELRRHIISHDQYGDEIAKIFRIPRSMLDAAVRMSPEHRKLVAEGAMDFEEAARRSRN